MLARAPPPRSLDNIKFDSFLSQPRREIKSSWPFRVWGHLILFSRSPWRQICFEKTKSREMVGGGVLLLLLSSAAPSPWSSVSLAQLLLLDIVCRDSPFSKQCGIVSISNLKNIEPPKNKIKKKKKKKEQEQPPSTFADGRPDTNTRRSRDDSTATAHFYLSPVVVYI